MRYKSFEEIYYKYFSVLISVIIILGCIGKTFAEDIRLTATVDQNVLTLDEQLKLTLTIHGTQDTLPPSFPSIDGFTLLFGPQISAQTRIINGDVSVNKGYTYVLQPTATGKFTIGASSVEYKGKVYSSHPIKVEVADAPRSSGSQSPDLEKLVFVELSTDKTEAYLYEQVVLSFKFYFQKGLPVADIDYAAPAVKNFMEEKLGDQRQYEEIRDGIIYNVLELRMALFPMVSGELTISPAKLKCNLIVQHRRERRDAPSDNFFGDTFFDDFFGREQKRYPIERTTGSITLRIKSLPEQGKPMYFKGAVGTYHMEVSTKAQQVKVGDPITLSMSVYGEGNIQTINEPVLVLNREDDFKLYPAESNTQITNREELIRGRKVFNKVIEPQKADLKFTPAIVFSFFDPRAGQYKTITKEPFPIVVEAEEQEVPIQLTFSPDKLRPVKHQPQILTHDILPIMTNLSSLRDQGSLVYENPFIAACLSIPMIIVITSFFITKKKVRLQTDIGYARNKRAHAAAKKRLKGAQTIFHQNLPTEFYSHLSKSMSDYLADKLNIPLASVTEDKVDALLKQRGVRDDITEEICRCMTDFDHRRFSRDGGSRDEMEHSLKLAEELIAKLERQL
ncbi:MAG: protein BatD [Candidatus Brocadia sp. AMX2]|uniref:Protein BatD n=1 Tax=Candidatus Brocadia sinica JPN1 TaxID=1197129 RepID=A0ABQ0JSE6_9BACT|nr:MULTISPECIES: BatD family protein [Brocadia]MBC6931293.1 protein BatD [Candidatus Brocadia sp.]MBL1168640.1 protein BatD [Candidatus Brocadia sp. AMX1]NOG43239.1 protein BatD [Planctomycetota bacterium]GIK12476.1 MAG: aerotolerance-like protein [Candidatus Brocadia sinica]KAA0245967.1 MAG: protein BatD [Candidatus Brocadia sp. AMX2]